MNIRRFISNLGTSRVMLKLVATKFKHDVNKCNSLGECVDLAFNFRFNPFPYVEWSIRPFQVKEEISGLLEILAKKRPKTIMEIGTGNGGTLFLFCKISSPDGVIISIDLPCGPFGGGYPAGRSTLYRSFVICSQKMNLFRCSSHALSTLSTVEKVLGRRKLDFLFIDGDHTYEGVKCDFNIYGRLVDTGGIISFHDIVPGSPEHVGGVPKFWKEIKRSFEHLELVENWKQGGYGIGVLLV